MLDPRTDDDLLDAAVEVLRQEVPPPVPPLAQLLAPRLRLAATRRQTARWGPIVSVSIAVCLAVAVGILPHAPPGPRPSGPESPVELSTSSPWLTEVVSAPSEIVVDEQPHFDRLEADVDELSARVQRLIRETDQQIARRQARNLVATYSHW